MGKKKKKAVKKANLRADLARHIQSRLGSMNDDVSGLSEVWGDHDLATTDEAELVAEEIDELIDSLQAMKSEVLKSVENNPGEENTGEDDGDFLGGPVVWPRPKEDDDHDDWQ